MSSAASFCVRQIDIWIDTRLKELATASGPQASLARGLTGQVAIAIAKMAYQINTEIFSGEHFRKLAGKGARAQRLLWASTSTKNLDDSDLKYVEALIGPNTVNTLPVQTLEAYRHHGNPASSLNQGVEEARQVLDDVAKLGFDPDQVAHQLEDEGVADLTKAYDKLMVAFNNRSGAVWTG